MSDEIWARREGVSSVAITRNIPYAFRWKIMQLKLMVQDIDALVRMKIIDGGLAWELKSLIEEEADQMIKQMINHIKTRRERIEKLRQEAVV